MEQRRFLTYLEALYELTPLDVAVLVGVEGIEDDAKLLSCEEDAKFWHHFLELKLVENSVLIGIELLDKGKVNTTLLNIWILETPWRWVPDAATYIENALQLRNIVNTLCVELVFDLVGDLFHTVLPVCHLILCFKCNLLFLIPVVIDWTRLCLKLLMRKLLYPRCLLLFDYKTDSSTEQ